MNVIWNGTPISHDKYPVCLGVTMDGTLSFKEPTRKLKAKIQSRNALLSKLANSKWGANPYTLRTTALALCFSTAEYACPVGERLSHAGKVGSALNDTCDELQDALNRPLSTRCTAWQESLLAAFAVKYPANLSDKNAIWTNDIPCTD